MLVFLLLAAAAVVVYKTASSPTTAQGTPQGAQPRGTQGTGVRTDTVKSSVTMTPAQKLAADVADLPSGMRLYTLLFLADPLAAPDELRKGADFMNAGCKGGGGAKGSMAERINGLGTNPLSSSSSSSGSGSPIFATDTAKPTGEPLPASPAASTTPSSISTGTGSKWSPPDPGPFCNAPVARRLRTAADERAAEAIELGRKNAAAAKAKAEAEARAKIGPASGTGGDIRVRVQDLGQFARIASYDEILKTAIEMEFDSLPQEIRSKARAVLVWGASGPYAWSGVKDLTQAPQPRPFTYDLADSIEETYGAKTVARAMRRIADSIEAAVLAAAEADASRKAEEEAAAVIQRTSDSFPAISAVTDTTVRDTLLAKLSGNYIDHGLLRAGPGYTIPTREEMESLAKRFGPLLGKDSAAMKEILSVIYMLVSGQYAYASA